MNTIELTAVAGPVERGVRPRAWLCELAQEDGTTRTQFVEQDPDGLRWNDAGEPSPYRTTPLYEAPRWVPVGERLPERSRTVLACYFNSANMLRRIRAHWIPAKTVEAGTDDECSEYDEATDTCWTPEGWYEQIDNWGEYSALAVCEGMVTHWMPLPEPPPLVGTGPNGQAQRPGTAAPE